MILSIKKIEKEKNKILEDIRKKYSLAKRDYDLKLVGENKLEDKVLRKEISVEITYKRKLDTDHKSKIFKLFISREVLIRTMTKKNLFIENCKDVDDYKIDLNRIKKEILFFKDLVKLDKEEVKLRNNESLLDNTQINELIQIYHRSDYLIDKEHSDNIQRVCFGDIKFLDLVFFIGNRDQKWFLCAENKYNQFSILMQMTDVSGIDTVSDSISFNGASIGINQSKSLEPKTIEDFVKECRFIESENSLEIIGKYIAKNMLKKDLEIEFNKVSLNKKFNLKDIMEDL